MNAEHVRAVIEQYESHGWRLRRVLMSGQSGVDPDSFPPDVEIRRSVGDGLWFSRRSQPGREAWELRRISASPFALVTFVEDDDDPETLNDSLAMVEQKMFSDTRPEPRSH